MKNFMIYKKFALVIFSSLLCYSGNAFSAVSINKSGAFFKNAVPAGSCSIKMGAADPGADLDYSSQSIFDISITYPGHTLSFSVDDQEDRNWSFVDVKQTEKNDFLWGNGAIKQLPGFGKIELKVLFKFPLAKLKKDYTPMAADSTLLSYELRYNSDDAGPLDRYECLIQR